MTIILSPAKKMNTDTDSFPVRDLPQFLGKTEELRSALRAMAPEALQKLWKCNDSIAALNVERPEGLRAFDRLGYRFCPEESNEATYTFIKTDEKQMA